MQHHFDTGQATQYRRLTIAVIGDLFSFSYPIHVWQGVADAARDVNVVYIAGGPSGLVNQQEPSGWNHESSGRAWHPAFMRGDQPALVSLCRDD